MKYLKYCMKVMTKWSNFTSNSETSQVINWTLRNSIKQRQKKNRPTKLYKKRNILDLIKPNCREKREQHKFRSQNP